MIYQVLPKQNCYTGWLRSFVHLRYCPKLAWTPSKNLKNGWKLVQKCHIFSWFSMNFQFKLICQVLSKQNLFTTFLGPISTIKKDHLKLANSKKNPETCFFAKFVTCRIYFFSESWMLWHRVFTIRHAWLWTNIQLWCQLCKNFCFA